jgi:hypothetical protein
VLDMHDDIERGMAFSAVYRKYIVNPAKKAKSQQLTSSFGGSLTPGAGPAGPGVPPAPNPMDVLGMLGGGPSTMNRLNAPLGDGSFASAQMGG